jgi:hypothetical protein
MRAFWSKMSEAKGDSTAQVVDLVVFLGYFSACLYAGGAAYETSYNKEFNINTIYDIKDISKIVLFFSSILYNEIGFSLSVIYIILFTILYYACRFVWRPWLGYFLISFLLYLTFYACVATGSIQGEVDARQDMLVEKTTKPVVKIYLNSNSLKYSSGGYHLLSENDQNFFIYEPQGLSDSVISVHAIRKNDVKYYEVTVR